MRHPSVLIVLAALGLWLTPPALAQFDPSARLRGCMFKHPVRTIASLEDLPPAIRSALGPIADKGSFFNTTDVFVPGRPSRQFVSAGQSGDRYFVWSQQGGIALFSVVAVYRLPVAASTAGLVTQQYESGGDLCQTIDTLLDAKPPR